eukprot:gene4357-4778_t
MEFPDTSTQGLLHNHNNDLRWRYVKNLDGFYHNMYDLYASKGLAAILLSESCALLSLAFTIFFSVYLIAFLNWSALLACTDEESCVNANLSLSRNPFRTSPTWFTLVVAVYVILAAALWVYQCLSSLQTISKAVEMEEFYRVQLGITGQEMQTMAWHKVLERFIERHEAGYFRISVKDKITIHDIVFRIMRKENYLIALINQEQLHLFPPWWMEPFLSSDSLYMNSLMEWSLSYCITDSMFTDDFKLSESFIQDVEGLQFRFQILGIAHFLSLPFLLLYMVIHFFLQNAQQFHVSRAYLGPRQWSTLSRWKLREWNEVPHFFSTRLAYAYTPAEQYLRSFHNTYLIIVARCLSYISGAFLAILLVVSFVSEGALLYVHILDHNLLWYIGIFSILFAATRAVLPDENQPPIDRAQLLKSIGIHTHHYPQKWMDEPDSLDVRDEVAELLPFKAQMFFTELIGVIMNPIILCFSLPRCAGSVLAFIKKHSKYVDGVGIVCDYCLFNFEEYSEDIASSYDGMIGEGDNNSDGQRSSSAMMNSRSMRDLPREGKLEKSCLAFHQAYPNLPPPDSAHPFLNKLEVFKKNKREEQGVALAQALSRSVFGQNSYMGLSNFAPPGHTPPSIDIPTDTTPPPAPVNYGNSDALERQRAREDGDPLDGVGEPAFLPPCNIQSHQQYQRRVQCVDPQRSAVPTGLTSPGESNRRFCSSLPDIPENEYYHEGSNRSVDRVADSLSAFNLPQRVPSGLGDQSLGGAGGRSLWGAGGGGGTDMLPSVLLSVFRNQQIDFENDFYWLAKFRQEKAKDRAALERSLLSMSGRDWAPPQGFGWTASPLRTRNSSYGAAGRSAPQFNQVPPVVGAASSLEMNDNANSIFPIQPNSQSQEQPGLPLSSMASSIDSYEHDD